MRCIDGKGPMPLQMLVPMLARTFPQYKLEDIWAMEDMAPLLEAASLLGWYDELAQARQGGWKRVSQRVADLMQYEIELGESEYDDAALKAQIDMLRKANEAA